MALREHAEALALEVYTELEKNTDTRIITSLIERRYREISKLYDPKTISSNGVTPARKKLAALYGATWDKSRAKQYPYNLIQCPKDFFEIKTNFSQERLKLKLDNPTPVTPELILAFKRWIDKFKTATVADLETAYQILFFSTLITGRRAVETVINLSMNIDRTEPRSVILVGAESKKSVIWSGQSRPTLFIDWAEWKPVHDQARALILELMNGRSYQEFRTGTNKELSKVWKKLFADFDEIREGRSKIHTGRALYTGINVIYQQKYNGLVSSADGNQRSVLFAKDLLGQKTIGAAGNYLRFDYSPVSDFDWIGEEITLHLPHYKEIESDLPEYGIANDFDDDDD